MNATSKTGFKSQGSSPSALRVRSRLALGAVLASLLLAGCASTSPTYHRHLMQGQVLSVEGDSLVVCIGERDGAQVGQELAVVRHVRHPGAPKAAGPHFRREPIGAARIAEVFDEHYARAQVLNGHPQINDVVELDRK